MTTTTTVMALASERADRWEDEEEEEEDCFLLLARYLTASIATLQAALFARFASVSVCNDSSGDGGGAFCIRLRGKGKPAACSCAPDCACELEWVVVPTSTRQLWPWLHFAAATATMTTTFPIAVDVDWLEQATRLNPQSLARSSKPANSAQSSGLVLSSCQDRLRLQWRHLYTYKWVWICNPHFFCHIRGGATSEQ